MKQKSWKWESHGDGQVKYLVENECWITAEGEDTITVMDTEIDRLIKVLKKVRARMLREVG